MTSADQDTPSPGNANDPFIVGTSTLVESDIPRGTVREQEDATSTTENTTPLNTSSSTLLGDSTTSESSANSPNKMFLYEENEEMDIVNWLSDSAHVCLNRFFQLGRAVDLRAGIDYYAEAVRLLPENHFSRPEYFGRFGEWLGISFIELEDPRDLDAAIEYKTKAADLLPDGHPRKLQWLGELAAMHLDRYRELHDPIDIKLAANYADMVVPEACPTMVLWLLRFANRCRSRFDGLSKRKDLDGLITYTTLAVLSLSDKHNEKPQVLYSLAFAHFQRFERLHRITDINASIDYASQAIKLTPNNDRSLGIRLSHQGGFYSSRFGSLGNVSDINSAIEFTAEALAHIPKNDLVRPTVLSNLGLFYHDRFERMGDIGDLELAIDAATEGAFHGPQDIAERPRLLSNLGLIYQTRFKRLSVPEDLDASIKHATTAVALADMSHPDRAGSLVNLGHPLFIRSDQLGELADLDKAIEYQVEALRLLPNRHQEKPMTLNSLSLSYNRRFERLGEVSDILAAIKYATEALSLAPYQHPYRLEILGTLGSSHLIRYQQLAERVDLDTALLHTSEALRQTPEGHPDKAARLHMQGVAHQRRFESFGDLTDIEFAIDYKGKAVSLTPDDHADKPTLLGNLGVSYMRRSDRLGELGDFDAAVEYTTKALLLTPSRHAERPVRLDSLGVSLCNRFTRLGHHSDLNAAVAYHSEAVRLAPNTHPYKHMWINNYSHSLDKRFSQWGDLKDLDTAIAQTAEAARLLPNVHPDKPLVLQNLGSSYRIRFSRLKQSTDLESAIDCFTKAILLLPDEHPSETASLINLSMAYYDRMVYFQRDEDFPELLQCIEFAAISSTGNPGHSAQAAHAWARICHSYRLPKCLDAYGRFVELIPQLAWLGFSVHRRYHQMSLLASSLNEAVSVAIELGHFDRALEWLETGRSVVWGQMLQLRGSMNDLRTANQKLADSLEHVASQLDSLGWFKDDQLQSLSNITANVQTIGTYRRMTVQWEKLLAQVRQVPSFERFILSKRLAIPSIPGYVGTVVVINVYKNRCDALALRPGTDNAINIPLPALSEKHCLDMRYDLATALQSNGLHSRCTSRRPVFGAPSTAEVFERILPMLWLNIVKPILGVLGYLVGILMANVYQHSDKTILKVKGDACLPRVTWCATGNLAFLPLHAAGCYEVAGERVYDYIVSSYTPTLSALTKPDSPPGKFRGILVIGQSSQTSTTPLPGTFDELDNIRELSANLAFTRISEEDATPSTVLEAIKEHSWVHLACHALQNSSDPTLSGFQLHGGQLELETLIRAPLPNAELVFLSACETAMGAENVPDEAVHLAAGMIMLGFRTAIATTWSIMDEDAPMVAKHFYSQMLRDGVPNRGKAAEALHSAIGELRTAVGVKEFWRWVPYVHIGC
ncbi:CHAT domain protein [Ceratobasidium sp. AG-Ba]|nr:CHAT domain protein [Ceratobasidium sp. AG-Ba]